MTGWPAGSGSTELWWVGLATISSAVAMPGRCGGVAPLGWYQSASPVLVVTPDQVWPCQNISPSQPTMI